MALTETEMTRELPASTATIFPNGIRNVGREHPRIRKNSSRTSRGHRCSSIGCARAVALPYRVESGFFPPIFAARPLHSGLKLSGVVCFVDARTKAE